MRSPGRRKAAPVADDMPKPTENFESWLLYHLAQAVEAGEVSADLLVELQVEVQAAKEVRQ